MTESLQKYFAPCGINHLLTDSFYEEDGVTWKPLGGWPGTIFKKHGYLSPGYRKIGPKNSQSYFESGALGADYRLLWMNDLAGPGKYGIINKNTKWECGPPDNQAVFDNVVPNCGWWTNIHGENKRGGANNEDKYFKYEARSGGGDLNLLYNMGHGSGREKDDGSSGFFGTQPRSRESNIIGIDTWIHAEKQSGGFLGANANEARFGVTNIFGMYTCASDSDRVVKILEFLECLTDENCEIDLDNFPIDGRSQFISSVVSVMGSRGNFEFSSEHQQKFAEGNYDNAMISEMKTHLKERGISAALIAKIIKYISTILEIIGIIDPDLDAIGPNIWMGNIDLLISYDIPTPVNDLVFYKKGRSADYNSRAEYWGSSTDDSWGYKHVSFTCDIELHATLDVIGSTWNGYLWNLSHTSGATRVRLMRFANCFPIRTVQTAMEPDDPRQDKYMAAIHWWDENDNMFDDRRWNRKTMRLIDKYGGLSSSD